MNKVVKNNKKTTENTTSHTDGRTAQVEQNRINHLGTSSSSSSFQPLRQLSINLQHTSQIESSVLLTVKSLQLFQNNEMSLITVMQFPKSPQRFIPFVDIQKFYSAYFYQNSMKHFKITCIKPQELLPFEVAVRVDKQMGYNGALVQTRGIVNEQTFNSFLVQMLHNLVVKYGSETLTANGKQMFDNVKIFWQYQMRGDHPHFKVPMLFMDKDYWIGLSDLANSGILSFYGISVITLQNNQVLLHTSAFRCIINTERLNVTNAAAYPKSENRYFNRTGLHKYFNCMLPHYWTGNVKRTIAFKENTDYAIVDSDALTNSNIPKLQSSSSSSSSAASTASHYERIQSYASETLFVETKIQSLMQKSGKQAKRAKIDDKSRAFNKELQRQEQIKIEIKQQAERALMNVDYSIASLKRAMLMGNGMGTVFQARQNKNE
jgi:hypothetical protein